MVTNIPIGPYTESKVTQGLPQTIFASDDYMVNIKFLCVFYPGTKESKLGWKPQVEIKIFYNILEHHYLGKIHF